MVVDRKGIAGVLLAVLLGVGCQGQPDERSAAATPEAAKAGAAVGQMEGQMAGQMTGLVAETLDAGGYTYVRVEADGQSVWAAGPQQVVATGSQVTVALDMPMRGFRSETLDRTFDIVYFVRGFGAKTGPANASPGPPRTGPKLTAADQTIADIYARRGELAGQRVRVRGEVVKANSAILGTNWIHIQDGSGGEGTQDLTVTTDAEVQVGAIVLVEGVLSLDRDFGAGYSYALIVEGATVTVE